MLRLIPIVLMSAEAFGFRVRWSVCDALIVKRSLECLEKNTRHIR